MPSVNVGLDIGTDSLKMAILKKGGAHLVSVRLPSGIIDSGRIVSPVDLSRLIKQVKHDQKIGASSCSMVLPSAVTYFRRLEMPAMTIEQLKLNLPYEFRDYIEGESSAYFYDYSMIRTINDASGKPEKMEMFAAASLKSKVIEVSDILRKAGFKLKRAIPHEMAYVALLRRYIAANPSASNEEFCIVDIGYNKTHLDIYDGDSFVASKEIDVGCRDVDVAISETLGIDQFVAGSYRANNAERALSLPACQAVYSRLATEIIKVMNFYRFNYPDNNLHDMYYCGAGSEIGVLLAVIDQQVDCTTHLIQEIMPAVIEGAPAMSECALALAIALDG